ncbi:serine--tRNA ligase [Silvanigrella paludirubra]|uniref:Serine--tRNA ligase n=1 Tax=Silvanigrella paludirubra TaxID=2499159 RepID=A0A6N6VW42_9BACT|nr:serine--tRNA ligase [Silvanigrella paludirubra]KAB8038663.1 serine--tRNA ligase [Silvanigrella paludirubra]
MLDPKFIRDNLEAIAIAAKNKKFDFNPALFTELYEKRSKCIKETEELRNKRNEGSDAVKKAKSKEERENLVSQMRQMGPLLEEAEKLLREVESDFDKLLLTIPSIPSEDTPIGSSDLDNVEIRKVGEVPNFSFSPKDHIELSRKLGIIDFERGTTIAGSRSYFLLGAGAELERAVHSLALDLLKSRGYKQYTVPVLVRTSAMEGTGYLPGGADQAYYVEKDDMWLVGTSEVPLASYHQNEILEPSQLPVKMCAWSTCFRREAGAAGKDTKGLYRVHQFQKIEQVVICEPNLEKSDKLHAELLKNAEDLLKLLELPYRVVQVCTGDLGQGQVKKNDIETWMPSRNNYGETHSCSSFYDYQARRLKIRTRDENGKNQFCFTLNNTAVATPRVLIPLIENHQTADGRIRIPKALQKYMGGAEFIE